MGFRDRLRKVSKAASQKLGNRTNKERSSSSSSSSLDASSSSLSSPCPKRQPLSAEAHQREVAMKTMSMMTPDMLEVLGLTEALDDPNSKAPLPWEPITSSPIKQIPRKKHVRINESYNTTFRRGRPQDEEYSRPSRRITKGSSSNHHSSSDSVSTSSTYSSSSESYEPVVKSPEDVCPSCWVLPEDNDCKGLTYVAGAVLALPVACAFICADNIFGTDFFGSMTGCSSNEASRCELLPTSIAIPPNKVVARCW